MSEPVYKQWYEQKCPKCGRVMKYNDKTIRLGCMNTCVTWFDPDFKTKIQGGHDERRPGGFDHRHQPKDVPERRGGGEGVRSGDQPEPVHRVQPAPDVRPVHRSSERAVEKLHGVLRVEQERKAKKEERKKKQKEKPIMLKLPKGFF